MQKQNKQQQQDTVLGHKEEEPVVMTKLQLTSS
jgi:hypothetical protein